MLLRAMLFLAVLFLGRVSAQRYIPLPGPHWKRGVDYEQGLGSVDTYSRRASASRSLSDSVSDSERRVSDTFLKSVETQLLKAIQSQLQSARRAGTLSRSSSDNIYQALRRATAVSLSSSRPWIGVSPASVTSLSSPVNRRSLVSWVSNLLKLDKKCCAHRVVCGNRRRKRQTTMANLATDLAKFWNGASQRFKKIKTNMLEKMCCAFDKGCPTGRRTG